MELQDLVFTKCKRRFDVTVKVQENQHEAGYVSVLESTILVWALGPSLEHMLDRICDAAGVRRSMARVSILWVREHMPHEYTPAQIGKMMMQEGYTVQDNPYTGPAEDSWYDAFEKESNYQRLRV